MTLSHSEVAAYVQRLYDAGDLEFASFLERHPSLLPDAAARDARRRQAGADVSLPSVGEVLARASCLGSAPYPFLPSRPSRPGRARREVPVTDAEFRAGALEFVEEVRSGFRRDAGLANGVVFED